MNPASVSRTFPLPPSARSRTRRFPGWRTDFRNFRVDRIAELAALERRYPDQAGRRLADFLRAMQAPGGPVT